MYHEPHAPHGAKNERDDFWTDIPEGSDMVPGALPPDTGFGLTESNTREPYRHGGVCQTDEAGSEAENEAENEAGDAEALTEGQASRSDPLGSWTGVDAFDAEEEPTQDQDDL